MSLEHPLLSADGLIFAIPPSPRLAKESRPRMLDAVTGDVLLTTQQAATQLGLSPRTLEGYRRKGGGPEFIAISRNVVRYRVSDLRSWIESRAAPHTAKARAILAD